jgi:hydrogenase maturation protease
MAMLKAHLPGAPESAATVLILGIGNVLLRDEGVGVRVVQALAEDRTPLPRGTRVVDGGTLGLELLPLLEDAHRVVFVDAVHLSEAPGTVRTLRDQELTPAIHHHLSPHQVGTADLLAVAQLLGVLSERVALVGIQPDAVEVGLELSEAVQQAIPAAVQAARAAAWSLIEG